jgi:hypothetical protein
MATENIPANQRKNISKRVVTMRTRKLMSWAAIGAEIGCAPRTARKLFQEARGEHQHHDHLPNKGGRFPTTSYLLSADTAPVLPGNGSNNEWFVPNKAAAEAAE